MSLDFRAVAKTQLKRAYENSDFETVQELELLYGHATDLPLYHGSGFQHPRIFIYTNLAPFNPIIAQWGLIPMWAKDRKFWNNTLNARGETIFEKASFKASGTYYRCILYVDGFFEHHHFKGKNYPYYITAKDDSPLALAGLFSEWTDRETGEILITFSIVTTKANELLTEIHNKKEPRMPFIVPEPLIDEWFKPVRSGFDKKEILQMIQAYPDGKLKAHTVKPLRGKHYIGNVEPVNNEFYYPELNTLF